MSADMRRSSLLSVLTAFTLVAFLELTSGLSVARAQTEPPHVPKTDFLPSRDMLQIPNPVGGENAARYGSCHGLVETALYYKMVRDGEQKLFQGTANSNRQERPTLGQVTKEIKDKYPQGDVILQGLGIAAQQHAYDQQEYVIKTDTAKRTVFENLKQGLDSGNPVRLVLAGVKNHSSTHVVAAYDYYRDSTGNLHFRVGDPNQPGNDKAEIVGDAKTKKFGDFKSGSMEFSALAVQTPLERSPEKLIMNVEKARAGDNPARDSTPIFKKTLEQQAGSSVSDRAYAAFDKVIGGVMIRYPASWTQTAADDPGMNAVFEQIARFVDENHDGACVFSLAPEKARVELVSLSRLLASGAATLGRLTSVRGYVLDEKGELFIAGTVDPGAAPISLDWFTVALKAVWRQGESPFVSLDPDPSDFSRPHHARVGGLPADCTSSDFVRVLLDADYLMKRISLGVEKPGIEHFSSWFDMLTAAPDSMAPGMHRDWLSPLTFPAADVFTARNGSASAVWFEDGVQIMTENLKRAQDGLVGTGESDPIAELAAADLTRHYPELARLYPNEFGKLSAIFDLCKLCAILRSQGIKCSALDTLCDRAVPGGLTRKEYEGIRPRQVGQRNLSVSGGATTRQHARRGRAIQAAQLASLIASARGSDQVQTSAGEMELPATVHIDASSLKYFSADLHMNAGIERFQEGDYEKAQSRLDLALSLDPEIEGAHFYRAIARFSDGRLDDAFADIDLAVASEPRAQAFRAILYACRGDEPAALRDAAAAEAKFAQETHVLGWCAMARYYAQDFENCERLSEQMLALTPLDRDGLTLRAMLGRMNRLGPTTSRQRVKIERLVPLALTDSIGSAYTAMMSLDVVQACDLLDRSLRLCDRHADNAAVQQLHLRERVQFQIANCAPIAANMLEKLGSSEQATAIRLRGARAAEDLVTAHPTWATACLARAGVKPGPGEQDRRVEYLVKAIDLDPAGDPLLEELNETMGTRYARALCLFGAMREVRPNDEKTAMKLADFVFISPGDPQLAALYGKMKKEHGDLPPELMKEVNEVVFSFWEKNKSDPFAIQLSCAFGAMAAMNAADKNDLKGFLNAAKPLLKCINQNGLPESVMNMAAMVQQVLWMRLGEFYAHLFRDDDRLVPLQKLVREGEPDVAAIDAEIDRVAAEAVRRIDPDLPAAAIVAAKSQIDMAVEKFRNTLRGAAEDRAGISDAERAKVAPLLEKWKGGEINDLAALFNTRAIAVVKYETELRSITLMLDIFARTSAMFQSTQPDAAGKFSDFISRTRADVDARSKLLRFEKPPLDWSAWKAGAANPLGVDPPPAAASAAIMTGTMRWTWIGGGVVVLLGGTLVALRFKKPASGAVGRNR